MSGVWRHRQVRRGDYEIEVDGQLVAFVSLQNRDIVTRPSLAIRQIVAALADTHGGTVDGAPGVDWQALGFDDQAQHDALVDQVAHRLATWRDNDLGRRALHIVNTRKLAAGLPARPPYSLDQLDELDRIIAAAPEIAHQDATAEGSAA